MSGKTIVVWFRKDLRVHDNEILTEAVRKGDVIIPVYCFDPRQFENTSFQTQKTGLIRTKFLIECVADLRSSLQKLGSDLLIRMGKPEDVLPELVSQYGAHEVYHHREVASEETRVSADVENALWRLKINLKHFIGHTLYHKEDLPFPINNIPDVFSSFRKKIERDSDVRACVPSPGSFKIPDGIEPGELPTLADLGFQEQAAGDDRAVMEFKGGETEALKRLKEYFWETGAVKTYKQTRNRLLGADYSSKFSPWIALGCLSPREVYWEIKKYEQTNGSSDSTHALFLQLLWRDYFRFMFKKYGNKFFQKIGFKGVAPEEGENQQDLFELWKAGRTGVPFIDANMKELNLTGFMSNRGRQNVASFLVKNMKVNWMRGASYFEEKLIDYCPANNWGNWTFVAGVGNDPKEYQNFNVLKQAREFDPLGEYVRHWIPELNIVEGDAIHQPWGILPAAGLPEKLKLYNVRPAFAPDADEKKK